MEKQPCEKAAKPKRRKRRLVVLILLAAFGAVILVFSQIPNESPVVSRPVITIKGLPETFDGLTIAFLADIHHGPTMPPKAIKQIVEMTNALNPDMVVLGGDYTYRSAQFIWPCAQQMASLRAPMGIYFILGNHDHWLGAESTVKALESIGAVDLDNKGVWMEKKGQRILLGGVDDLWSGKPRLRPCLDMMGPEDICVLVSHNPDYAEKITDPRIRLVLSGHTHGGQVYIPGIGAPIVPSRYGQKYRAGLVQAPSTQVYVSRGAGSISPNIRIACPPEIALITLRRE